MPIWVFAWLLASFGVTVNAAGDSVGTVPATVLHSQDGRYRYFVSCDGRLEKQDRDSDRALANAQVGETIHAVAISDDGAYLAVANRHPGALVILDKDLKIRRTLAVRSHDGRSESTIAAIYYAAPRYAFVAVLYEIPEVWEISTDRDARDIPTGFIHDHRMREGNFITGYLNPRRTRLKTLFPLHAFNQDFSLLRMTDDEGGGQIISLDARKTIAGLPLPETSLINNGTVWAEAGKVEIPCAE